MAETKGVLKNPNSRSSDCYDVFVNDLKKLWPTVEMVMSSKVLKYFSSVKISF